MAKSNYDAASDGNRSNRSGRKYKRAKTVKSKSKKSRRKGTNNDDIVPGPKPVKLDLPSRHTPDENEENMRKYL